MKQINETKLVTITRSDISDGYKVVQSAHAVADFAYEFPQTFKNWKEDTNSIICLAVKSEEDLLKLFDKLNTITQAVLFFEPDVNQHTSMCIYGTPEIRKKLNSLPLLK